VKTPLPLPPQPTITSRKGSYNEDMKIQGDKVNGGGGRKQLRDVI
jgi:hypothetical protein